MIIRIDMFAFIKVGDLIRFRETDKEYAVIGKTIDRLLLSGNGEKFSITGANLNRDMNRKKIELV
mgnify:FL=1